MKRQVVLVCCAAGGSGRLGTTGLDNTLVISELTQPLPRLSDRLVSTQLQQRAPLAMRTTLSLAAVDISIMDHMPEELLMLYAAHVHASSELNVGAAARFTRASVTIGHVQVSLNSCPRTPLDCRTYPGTLSAGPPHDTVYRTHCFYVAAFL